MNKIKWNKLFPHIIAVVIFLVIGIIYCKPLLEGKVIQQSDVRLWKTSAQNSFEYKEKHGYFPLWSNAIFSGMPAFQITSVGSNPISIVYASNVITLNLPKPLSFFFLACICFYFLSLVLGVQSYIGILGALSYAYATYNPIIIAAGHDTKMVAIAYLPAFLASLLLVYHKKYLWGAALTAVFTTLLIAANHLQITYYSLLLAIIVSVWFGVVWIRNREFKHLSISVICVVISAFLGITVNSVNLYTTGEYATKTIRGGSELAIENGETKKGLGKDYAMSYSVYKTEPLVMMFPYLYGGSSRQMEVKEEDSKAVAALQEMPPQLAQQIQQNLQFYWGGIDGVGTDGPPYIGAIICFFALIGFFVLNNKHKWWLLTAAIFTLILSWGKYFQVFNSIVLDVLPLYNKFRAPSMILVIPTLAFCVMATLSIDFIFKPENTVELFKKYKKILIVVSSVFCFVIFLYFISDFLSLGDKELIKNIGAIQDQERKAAIQAPVTSFINQLKTDRQSLFWENITRSFLLIVAAGSIVYLYSKQKIKRYLAVLIIGVISIIDVLSIDSKYLNAGNYQEKEEYNDSFKPTLADLEILKDTGYYRVLDVSMGIGAAFNGGPVSSYFHKSIGGYHPAKLSIYQDIIEKQLYNFPNCLPVLNMLNAKYIIMPNQQKGSGPAVQINPNVLGAAWFVKAVDFKAGSAAIMQALTNFSPKDTAFVNVSDRNAVSLNSIPDSSSTITLDYNDNDVIQYKSASRTGGFVVFSEIFYDEGWGALIDGKPSPIIRTNYLLRGLNVPGGDHNIVFSFRPKYFNFFRSAAIAASAIIWILLLTAAFFHFRRKSGMVEN